MPARKPRPHLKWIPVVMIVIFVLVFALILFLFIPRRANAVAVFDEAGNPAPIETAFQEIEPLPDEQQTRPPVSAALVPMDADDAANWDRFFLIALVAGCITFVILKSRLNKGKV